MPSPRGHIAVLCACAFALVAAAPALSDVSPPPPGTPSIDQYVETVPNSGGGWSVGTGSKHSQPLRPAVVRHLRRQPGLVTKKLESVATSSAYGAPQRKLSPPPAAANSQSAKPTNDPNRLSAAIGAVSSSGDSHIYWLLAAMIVVTTTMVRAAARRNAR